MTALVASTMAMISPPPSSAVDGTILRSFTADAGVCSVGTGVAFDGTSLLISCNYNNILAAVSPADGLRVGTYTVAGMSAIGAMAWDRGRNRLWACEGFGGNVQNVWLIDLATSTATFKFTSGGCVDGLGYDGTDDTLWTSADAASVVNHYRPDGTLISANSVSGKLGGCGNSGIAVGGAYLFLANNGCDQIYAVSKDFSQSSLFGTYPARLEDLECDDKTFAAQGKAAVWSKDAHDNVLNAFEANVGTCGFGGYGSGPAGDPLGLLETLGAANRSFRYNPQCNTHRPVNCATGNFWHEFEDLSIPGRGPSIDLRRTYNSLAADRDGPFGYGWASSYTMSLSVDVAGVVTIRQENGATVTFKPDGAGGYGAPPRVLATLTRQGDGTYTFVRQKRQTFSFASDGRLTSQRDLNGYVTTLGYDPSGRVASVAAPGARTLTFAYGPNGRISQASDSGGRTLSYVYNAGGELTSVTDVAGGVTGFTYDGTHRALTMVDPRGGVVTNVYDAQSRVTDQTDPLLRKTIFAYDASGTTITSPKGTVVRQDYRDGELVTLTKGVGTPEAAVWRYSYDPFTLGVTSVVDPNGRTSSQGYDRSGNMVSQSDALGRTTTSVYGPLDQLLSSTDASGVTTTLTYDGAANLLSTSRPLTGTTPPQAQTVAYAYADPARPGDVTSMTDPKAKVWSFTYDGAGNPASSSDPLGNKSTFGYDSLGRRTSVVSPKGNVAGANPATFTTNSVYNAFGDATAVTDPLGHATTRTFDANRNLTKVVDAKNQATSYAYDAADQQITVTRADQTTLGSTYDANGNLATQKDGLNKATTYAYDALNRATSVTDPLGRVTANGYDKAGNRTTVTNPSGQTTTSVYDAANQVTAITYSDGITPNVSTITYNANGQRTAMTDGTGTSTWTWDSLHRLVQSKDGAGSVVGYGYDLKDQSTSLTYPGGTNTVTRTYDDAGRMTAVADWLGHSTAFAYDANANPTTETLPSTTGVIDTTTFDAADRLMAISDAKGANVLASFAYGRDAGDQVNSVTPTGVGEANTAYGYSALDQLTQVGAAGKSGLYSAGRYHSLAVKPDGSTWAWGYNAYGQLGNNTTTNSPSPIAVPGLTGVAAVATGAYHSLAAKADGTVWAWGSNTSGMLGNNSTVQSKVPVQSQGLTGVVSVKAGNAHSLVLKSDGTVWVWGDNTYGQLGNANPALTRSLVPVQVPGLSGISVIAAGGNFNLAVGADGSVWAWGQGTSGQVGNGGIANVFTPFKIPGLANAISVSAGDAGTAGGGYHALALAKDGAVWAWGANNSGQLGDNTTVDRTIPVKVSTTTGLSQVVAVAGGTSHSMALSADGSVWTWGEGTSGQMGNGAVTTPNKLPTKVPGLSGVAAVAAGGDRNLVRKADGNLWGWGDNARGQLGDGTVVTPKTTPTAVVGLGPIAAPSYAYDAGDNLTKLTSGATLGYDVAHQLTSLANAGSTRTYTYDTRGNRKTDTAPGPVVTNYGYDQANRMTSAGASATYAYNGDGLRTSKTITGTAQAFVWDVSSGLPELLKDGTTSYIYGPGGLPLERIDAAGTVLYYHHDQLGSTRALTDAAGAVAGTYTYDPYGKLTASTGAVSQPFGYAGEFTDAETGFQYLRARYYDPATGQFLTRDPIEAVTRSAYGYVGGNPLNGTDPSGLLFGWDNALVGGIGALGGALGSVGSQVIQGVARGQVTVDWADVGVSAGSGFAAGFVLASNPVAAGVAGGAAADALTQLRHNGGNIRAVNPVEVGSAALFGGVGAGVGRSVAANATYGGLGRGLGRMGVQATTAQLRNATEVGFGLFTATIDPSFIFGLGAQPAGAATLGERCL